MKRVGVKTVSVRIVAQTRSERVGESGRLRPRERERWLE